MGRAYFELKATVGNSLVIVFDLLFESNKSNRTSMEATEAYK